jgi:hypothetical protein
LYSNDFEICAFFEMVNRDHKLLLGAFVAYPPPGWAAVVAYWRLFYPASFITGIAILALTGKPKAENLGSAGTGAPSP